MRFLSLFSGIGGLDLGLERAGMTCVGQVEIDPYCRVVLAKHWPDVPRHDDVTTYDPRTADEFDLIAAGFPCQDVSNAGKRTGISGTRSRLYRRVVFCLRLVRPKYALLENVAALLKRGMGRVLGDMAASGYDAEWDCVPAGAFGAHFMGDRVFIFASRAASGCVRWEGVRSFALGTNQWGRNELEGLVRTARESGVPAGSFGRVSDGVSHRMDRTKGLGNSVVPQVAEAIGRAVMEVDQCSS